MSTPKQPVSAGHFGRFWRGVARPTTACAPIRVSDMDTHFLAPLFTPRSVVVFAGPPDEPARQTRQAQV
ncbi:hypothetical protein, partial [Escherichia coli]